MSVEDRLRNGLARNAASLHPQVEVQLNVVLRRTRRRNRLRWAGTAVLVILVVPAVTALVAALVGGRPQPAAPLPTMTTQETAPARQALTGSFTATVAATASLAQQRGLAGAWTLRFQAEGNLTVQAPAEYPGVLSGALFTATQGQLRTSLFEMDLCSGDGIGTYHWVRSGTTLLLTVVDDTCEGRVTVLASTIWTSVP